MKNKTMQCNGVHQSIKRAPHAYIWYLNKLALKMHTYCISKYNDVY